MHELVRERLEEFLQATGEREGLTALRAHIMSCESCRREVADMGTQARMLQLLRSPAEIETDAGFYAQVMERIESRRSASALYAFMDPAFARRLMFASLTALLVVGSYLVYAERAPLMGESSPVAIIATQTPEQDLVGANPARDRETMLLTLASYQE